MILTCPSCGTQYVVKDGAIPPEGRQVRCASCKHSWHQDAEESAASHVDTHGDEPSAAEPSVERRPDAAAEPEIAEESEPAAGRTDESLTEATLIEPRSGPEAEQRAYEEASLDAGNASLAGSEAASDADGVEAGAAPSAIEADRPEPPAAEVEDDEFTPFPAGAEVERPRRNPILSILVVVVAVIVLAAAFWFLAPPQLKAQLGLAELGTSPLALVTTHMDRQQLASGNELLTVTGRVINPTGKQQDVPPLQAQLKTKAGKIVYSWTIAPPARSLPAGASASFNSAEVNVPPGGDELTITLGTQAG
jgi:predicted Zn finger-like uncharacterized protein